MSDDNYSLACHAGALEQIEAALAERVKRLKELADKMPLSLQYAQEETGEGLPPEIHAQQKALIDRWPEIAAKLEEGPATSTGAAYRDSFLSDWEQMEHTSGHIKAVGGLSAAARKAGVAWLQEIVNSSSALWQ
jgi:hypothetical protein